MKKTVELARGIKELSAKVKELMSAGDVVNARAEGKKLAELMNDYKVAQKMESVQTGNNFNVVKENDKMDKNLKNRVFNALLLGRAGSLDGDEREYAKTLVNAAGTPGQVGATPAKGGYLLPEESAASIEKLMNEEVRLKNYCDVKSTNFRSGSIPTRTRTNHKLTNFDEITSINKTDIDFGQIPYTCKSYGSIIPVSNELLEDVDVDLAAEIGEEFALDAVDTENDEILKVINAGTGTPITDYKGVQTALNVTLKPAVAKRAVIVTNQSGFDYLDKIEDENGHPLMTMLPDEAVYKFKGKEVVVLSNETLPNDTTTGVPFLVGSLRDAVKFIERKGVVVAVSSEAGFETNSTLLRAVERFDVRAKFAGAVVKLTYKA